MITTRPLFPEALTAAWIELNAHFLASFFSVDRQQRLCVGGGDLHFRLRGTHDVAIGLGVLDRLLRASERVGDLHTTFVVVASSADASVRGVGTAPPAHGVTLQSGSGSGQ